MDEGGWERTAEDEIIAELHETGAANYSDVAFEPDKALYRDSTLLPSYAIEDTPTEVRWLRPPEFVKSPDYFKDIPEREGVLSLPAPLCRGPHRLNDEWLLGAVAALSTHPAGLLENLIGSAPDDFKRYGVFTMRLYKSGRWIDVVTDTRIPCVALSKDAEDEGALRDALIPADGAGSSCFRPLYACTADANEQYVSLIEKAYAKYHGCYQALSEGDPADALVELTGGSCDTIHLTQPAVADMAKSGKLWDKLVDLLRDESIVVTATIDGITEGYDPDPRTGLLSQHPYQVVMCRTVVGMDMVRVRCLFSRGLWSLDWSDDSIKWDDYPEVMDSIMEDPTTRWQRHNGDGTFWMTFSDFAAQFSAIQICRTFNDEAFKQYCVFGEWADKSAGGRREHGPQLDPRVAKGKKKASAGAAAEPSGTDAPPPEYAAVLNTHCRDDVIVSGGEPSWFNNPQYQLLAPHTCTVHLSLMSEDRRSAAGLKDNAQIGFQVVRMRGRDGAVSRCWGAEDPSDIVADTTSNPFVSPTKPQREVSVSDLRLQGGVRYNIIPHLAKAGQPGNFVLRVFSEDVVEMRSVPETITTLLPGRWERDAQKNSAGGPLLIQQEHKMASNPKWCENPQYVLTLGPVARQTGVDAVVVVRRTGLAASTASSKLRTSSASKPPAIGLLCCKVPPPPEKRLGKLAPGDHRTNALGEVLPSKDSSLKQSRSKYLKLAQAAAQSEELPERRTVVSAKEWHKTSNYSNAEVAVMQLPRMTSTSTPNGLFLVPSLSQPLTKGTFTVEVHSDGPLNLELLPESNNCTVSGCWAAGTAGGNHMHPTFRTNPRYQLRLFGDRPAKVKITLSRPSHTWKPKTGKDPIGSMLGFYVLQGENGTRETTAVIYEGEPWSETSFVPMDSCSSPPNLLLDPLEDNFYVIVPATFEPNFEGPFFLSVVSDVECSLQLERPPTDDKARRGLALR